MTEIISRNEFDKSYLLIDNTITEEDYVFNMLTKNSIEGIPECKVRYLDDKMYLAYDVTEKRSLEKMYVDRKMKFDDLTELFYGIAKIMRYANEYLLDRNGFLLHPQYMFIDMESEELSCMYYPQPEDAKVEERYRPLSDFLLDRIDHKDEHAVTLAYHFYKISKEEYFSFDGFISFMEKECLLVQSENRKKENLHKEEREITLGREIIVEDDVSIDEREYTGGKCRWGSAIGLLVLGLGLLVAYCLISDLREYALYILIPGLTILVIALVLLVQNGMRWFRQKNTENYEEPIEPVRIEEYFEDLADDVTVFFDQDEYMTLKWKEGHFSKEYIMEEYPVTVGKMKNSVQAVIEDSSVSRLHARFCKQGKLVYLQDLDSTNGTYVNERHLLPGEEIIIKRGDEIQFGKIIVNVV